MFAKLTQFLKLSQYLLFYSKQNVQTFKFTVFNKVQFGVKLRYAFTADLYLVCFILEKPVCFKHIRLFATVTFIQSFI